LAGSCFGYNALSSYNAYEADPIVGIVVSVDIEHADARNYFVDETFTYEVDGATGGATCLLRTFFETHSGAINAAQKVVVGSVHQIHLAIHEFDQTCVTADKQRNSLILASFMFLMVLIVFLLARCGCMMDGYVRYEMFLAAKHHREAAAAAVQVEEAELEMAEAGQVTFNTVKHAAIDIQHGQVCAPASVVVM
jgi:hypothetical protein